MKTLSLSIHEDALLASTLNDEFGTRPAEPAELAEAVTLLGGEQSAELESVKSELSDFQDSFAVTVRTHAEAIAAKDAEIITKRDALNAAHRKAIEGLRETMATAEAEHVSTIEGLTSDHETSMAEAKTANDAQIETLNLAHKEAVDALNTSAQESQTALSEAEAAKAAAENTLAQAQATVDQLNEQISTLTAEPEFPTIRAWQAKAVLSLAGLLDQAQEVIESLPEPQQTIVQSAWDNNADFARNSTTILSLAEALSLTDEQLDGMFAQAEALTV